MVVVVVREYLFVETPTLDLDIIGHSTHSVDSVVVEFRRG
jgi:hypothetical protein